jgi:hypothetical protein
VAIRIGKGQRKIVLGENKKSLDRKLVVHRRSEEQD